MTTANMTLRSEPFFIVPPPEPSAVDRLAALDDPQAAERCADYDEWDAKRALDKVLVEKISKAPVRTSVYVDLGDAHAHEALDFISYFKRKLRGD